MISLRRSFRFRGTNDVAKRLVITTFFFAILVLCFQMATAIVPIATVVENRKLAPWPAFERDKGIQKYIEAAQLWFDDHFGFRAFFIRLKTQTDYSIFNYSSQIDIGKDGWLYYRDTLNGNPSIGQILSTIDVQVVAGVKELNRALRRQGVTLIFVTVPLKAYFYPNFVPPSAAKLVRPSRFESLYNSIRNTEIYFLWIRSQY